MKCLVCNNESFILESSVLLTEKFKIYKNGRVADHPFKSEIDDSVLNGEQDNIVICTSCSTEYILYEKDRDSLINKTNFSKIDLKINAKMINEQ